MTWDLGSAESLSSFDNPENGSTSTTTTVYLELWIVFLGGFRRLVVVTSSPAGL